VAEEVRSLALRSKEAAQKTEELIRQSVHETETGVVTSKLVNEKLSEIAQGITKVTDIVTEIASTAREQASGIAQVNEAMGQMSKVTQQNAANSEQSSSAAQELASQSEELAAMVSSFQVKRGEGAVGGGAHAGRRNGTGARLAMFPADDGNGYRPRALG
jgi:methyl-accepting chemotaxis protein